MEQDWRGIIMNEFITALRQERGRTVQVHKALTFGNLIKSALLKMSYN